MTPTMRRASRSLTPRWLPQHPTRHLHGDWNLPSPRGAPTDDAIIQSPFAVEPEPSGRVALDRVTLAEIVAAKAEVASAPVYRGAVARMSASTVARTARSSARAAALKTRRPWQAASSAALTARHARPAQCAPSARRLAGNWRSIVSCVQMPTIRRRRPPRSRSCSVLAGTQRTRAASRSLSAHASLVGNTASLMRTGTE